MSIKNFDIQVFCEVNLIQGNFDSKISNVNLMGKNWREIQVFCEVNLTQGNFLAYLTLDVPCFLKLSAPD